MNICEFHRRQTVEETFQMRSFQNGWDVWKGEISNLISSPPSPRQLLDLGNHLSTIFRTTAQAGRRQGALSGGGYAWEGLICWYLNLGFIGSRGVAVKKISNLPEPLRDAISVNYGTFNSNTESDIAVVIFPNLPAFTEPLPNNIALNDIRARVNQLTEEHFDQFELGIIQCKTNWNDNAQIPMLWGMIYESQGFTNHNISIGRNGYNMRDLARFTYSFCTLPIESLSSFDLTTLPVHQVHYLSGGNYWGYPTKQGVANSIQEIFTKNFRNAFDTNQRKTLSNSIMSIDDCYGLSLYDKMTYTTLS